MFRSLGLSSSAAFVPALFLALLMVPCAAQEVEGDLVYKFKVAEVHDPAAAKPALVALLVHGDAHDCRFIDEADLFSLVMPMAITRQTLIARLSSAGYALVGPVLVSDGTVLVGPSPMLDDQ